jgi:caffeoyl-CoA O-methyltransferase
MRSALRAGRIQAYVEAHGTPPDDVQRDLIARTEELGPDAIMRIGVDQGNLLTLLVRLTGVRRAVEVGTFTGYSSICIARGLADGGRLLCCDVSEEWTAIARAAWAKAGLDDRIELRLAPALETLRALPADEAIDFAFIDADKGSYWAYYSELLPRLRPGGVIAVDNVLWSGKVADPDTDDPDAIALRDFNARIAADDRVEVVILAIGDGLSLIRKK